MLGSITKHDWGKTKDGRPVSRYVLTNKNGVTMAVTDYGCIIISLSVPDRNGNHEDIVLGYERLEDYMKNSPYFGCVVGRLRGRRDVPVLAVACGALMAWPGFLFAEPFFIFFAFG